MVQPLNPSAQFQSKMEEIHGALRKWHLGKFSQIEGQLQNCRKAIMFFDAIEEKRVPDKREFSLRIKIRAQAYELAQITEIRWRQRSRVTWLQSGDKNTRYFHSYASARARKNAVQKIRCEGEVFTKHSDITRAFYNHMKAVLGAKETVMEFVPSKLYPQTLLLDDLQVPFSESEIEAAVRQLAKNKASGPDGLPSEFVQTFWPLIKGEIITIFYDFYHNRLDLSCINRANIIFAPKKEIVEEVGDFRPISIINVVPKLISKVLSNRLRPKLHALISAKQTTFVKKRHITETFTSTRELLQEITRDNGEAVFLKLDFTKAFDSIHWSFLINVMSAWGFPERWIDWISSILTTSTSRVVLNGERSDYFTHKRGLRQGDPLSPMLFIVAADVLQQMVQAINTRLPVSISGRIPESILALQYADDMAIIASASRDLEAIMILKIILRLFSKIFGLHINYNKSCFVPFNLDEEVKQKVKEILGCPQTELPMT